MDDGLLGFAADDFAENENQIVHNRSKPKKTYLELVQEQARQEALLAPSTPKKTSCTKLPSRWNLCGKDEEPTPESNAKTAASEAKERPRLEAETWTCAVKMMDSETSHSDLLRAPTRPREISGLQSPLSPESSTVLKSLISQLTMR